MDKYIKRYDEELKRRMVSEIESGIISIKEVSNRCQVGSKQVRRWLEEYGKYRPKRDILEVVMKSEEERIRELEKALAEAHLELRLYGHIIEFANKQYKTDLKKNFGQEQLAKSAASEKGVVSSKPVKS